MPQGLNLGELKKLHDKGLALIYLRPKSKRPFEERWTSGEKKPWAELENSFEKTYNVGVRLGEPSKLPNGRYLGAIDCDVKAKSRKALTEMNDKLRELGLDLDTAPVVMSGRGNGSKHIYVQTLKPMQPMRFARSEHKVKVAMPGEKKPYSEKEKKLLTADEMAQGIRIRPAWEISFMGTGQQTVLPPSVHPDTGMRYAWASPLVIKHAPLFEPSRFVADRPKRGGESSVGELDFKAEDVDLYSSSLSIPMIKMIETGEGCDDRSNALLSIAMSMCRAKFTDNQILSVLSDPNHWISSAAYDRRHGRKSAVEWLYKYTLVKARYETDVMRFFDNPPVLKALTKDEAMKQVKDVEADAAKVFPDLDGKGAPKSSLRNVVHALEHFLGGHLVGFNRFANRAYFQKDTAYGGKKGQELTDHDDLALKHYLASHYRFEPSKELCFEAHAIVARMYAFHPVQDYLRSLTWDGEPRLNDWLKIGLGATGPDDYVSAVSAKTLIGAVARIFKPGVKFDQVLVLEGLQGKGKSTALEIMAGEKWFTDGLGDIHHKDVVDQMTGKWIIELGELASIRKAEAEFIKAFLSRKVDRVRMSYGRRSEDYPRQSIFIGSTNADEYLNDPTGARRMWPLSVDELKRKWLKRNRDQIWAEAVVRYESGEEIYLSKELEETAKREQDKRYQVDEWELEIKQIIQKGNPEATYRTTDLWRALNLSNGSGHPSDHDAKRIGKVMRRLGYKTGNRRFEGAQGKCWVKDHMIEGATP